jgi:hypothetical protein
MMNEGLKQKKQHKVFTFFWKSLHILLIAQSLSLSPLYQGMNVEDQVRLIRHLRDRTNYDASPLKRQLRQWVKTGSLSR